MRYFLDISYKGTNYHGWQKQPNVITVQEEIEDKVSKIIKEEIKITASGRTDAGVHASQQIAFLDTEQDLETEKFMFRINSFLNKDISINSIRKVKADAHTRFDAKDRTYHYYINKKKTPFQQELSWYFRPELDVLLMNEAAQHLLDFEDFTSFSKLHTDTPHNLCKIHKAEWSIEGSQIVFEIVANRFLRGMVRAVVGTLVEVGLHNVTSEDFKNIIAGKDRKLASSNAPSDGLYLSRIKYDEDIYL